MTESDHDILIELRSDVKYIIQIENELKVDLYGADGICARVRVLENNQNRSSGRDGVLAAIVAGIVSLGTAIVALKTSWFG